MSRHKIFSSVENPLHLKTLFAESIFVIGQIHVFLKFHLALPV